MAGVPRSQKLLAYYSTASGGTPAFQCPDGHVTLVKSAFLFNGDPAAAEAILLVHQPTPAVDLRIFVMTIDPGKTAEWEGWIVLNPGDYVYAVVAAAAMGIWVSGAVLQGPPLFPPGSILVSDLLGPQLLPG